MNPGELEIRFARCRGLLHFVACRVLGGSEGADRRWKNCFLTAARNPQQFEYEGALRSWLARIVIDEALAIVRKRERGLKCEEDDMKECLRRAWSTQQKAKEDSPPCSGLRSKVAAARRGQKNRIPIDFRGCAEWMEAW